MREYLLAWRALPKLAVGEVFILELVVVVLGRERSVAAYERFFEGLVVRFNGVTLLIAIILILLLGASLGNYALNTLATLVRHLGEVAFSVLPARWRRSPSLRTLVETPHEIATRIFADRGDFYKDIAIGRSSSYSLENLEKASQIEAHFSGIRLLLSRANPSDIESIVYQGSLSQERRSAEIIMDGIQVLENVVLVAVLSPIAVAAAVSGFWIPIGVLAAATVLTAAVLPEIVYRKRFLGGFLLTTSFELFAVSEGADIADRPGEPYV